MKLATEYIHTSMCIFKIKKILTLIYQYFLHMSLQYFRLEMNHQNYTTKYSSQSAIYSESLSTLNFQCILFPLPLKSQGYMKTQRTCNQITTSDNKNSTISTFYLVFYEIEFPQTLRSFAIWLFDYFLCVFQCIIRHLEEI